MVNKLKDKKFWEKGTGEFISFLILLPVVAISFLILIYIMQVSLTAQSLSYTVYSATRAAVVSESEAQARTNAEAITKRCLPKGYMSIKNASWDYEVVDGDPSVWVKGNLIEGKVTLTSHTISIFGINPEKEFTASVICMVERPAT